MKATNLKMAALAAALLFGATTGTVLADGFWAFDEPAWKRLLSKETATNPTQTADRKDSGREAFQPTRATEFGDPFFYRHTGGVPPQ